jgi:cytochrome c-550 PedF
MNPRSTLAAALAALMAGAMLAGEARAHGDVAPQPVDISGLPPLGEELRSENPYRDTDTYERAKEVGAKAYNQNCARCHGLGAVSGGIAPDLRYLVPGDDDEYFLGRVMSGAVRNGVTYMPPFGEIFSQEAIWAIRSWLDSVHVE